MKKIIVAGAGHGGISAAMNLAKSGYSVAVYEKNSRDKIGYDWLDCVRRRALAESGFPQPDESYFTPMHKQCYYNPAKTKKLVPDKPLAKSIGNIDRKFLINYIIDYASSQGVEFVFDTEVLSPVCDDKGVKGIKIRDSLGEREISSDLVIDAAGLYSPVRTQLPEDFDIPRYPEQKETFHTWRGYFAKTEEFKNNPRYSVYFFHCGKAGLDWAINEDDYIDILVGGFGALSQKQIDEAVADFKKDYPLGELVRGGYGDVLPLGRMLPVFVCNGYAAVGNSAFMTEPLSGSGIDLSLFAGKILAETVIESDGDFSVEALWKYNYTFFKKYAQGYYNEIIIKSFLSGITAEDIDFFFEKEIFTEKEIAGGASTKYGFTEILSKGLALTRPNIYPAAAATLRRVSVAKKLRRTIPEGYNKLAVEKWLKLYKQFR